MSADYLAASLPALAFDAPAPMSLADFDALCRDHVRPGAFDEVSSQWADMDAQLRNAAAAERARARGEDPSRWMRPAKGLSLFYAKRIADAFREKNPARREALLDRARWDAAGDLIPPYAPLSAAAVFAYRVRLEIALKRSAIGREAGNEVFNKLASAATAALSAI